MRAGAGHQLIAAARVALACLWLLISVPAAAANHALLIGVGRYPHLASELQLKAPANDVRLLRDVLIQRGFEAARVQVLADDVPGARTPTREAIVEALQGLAARAAAGDTVFLHFSGHGSLQPEAQGAAGAGDRGRWRPVFLPSDARSWDGKAGAVVPNAITDTTLRELVDRINDSGAFVFALFDACHSARLVRGALPGTDAPQVRVRQVSPAALGVPGDAPPHVGPVWPTPRSDTAAPRRGRAVYFYAAQSNEVAMAGPQGDSAAWHGLFTWQVAQALALGQPMSYRQLGHGVLAGYERLPAAVATPLFAGDGLDDAVFAQTAPRPLQWALEPSQGRAFVAAGSLLGLGEGALLAVLSDPLAGAGQGAGPPRGTLGYVRVARLAADRAEVEPVAWSGFAATPLEALPRGAWARLVHNMPAFALHVFTERGHCPQPCAAWRALEQLRREGVAGVDVRWVERADAADAQLQATERGVRLRLPGQDQANDEDLGIALRAGTADEAALALASEAAAALHRVARTRNVLRLAARLAMRQTSGVTLSVEHRSERTARLPPPTMERVSELSAGDLLVIGGHNGARDAVDFAIFWLDSRHGIRQVYPADPRDTSRLAPGQRLSSFALQAAPRSSGLERLLVVSAPMKPGREASDFRFLEQTPLTRLRSGGGDADLQALLDACFAEHLRRGDAAPAPPVAGLALSLYTFQLKR